MIAHIYFKHVFQTLIINQRFAVTFPSNKLNCGNA